MSLLIDINGRYTETGNLLQLEYARKAAGRGRTAIGIKFKDGVLLAVEKSRASRIVDVAANKVITPFTRAFAMAYSGLGHDNNVVAHLMKSFAKNVLKTHERQPRQEEALETLRYYLRYFSASPYTRPVGCEFLVSSFADGKAHLVHVDPSGNTTKCRAYAIGESSQAAKTELEKLDVSAMSLDDAVRNAVRIFYVSGGDSAPEQNIELEMMQVSRDTNFVQVPVDASLIRRYSEEFTDISMEMG